MPERRDVFISSTSIDLPEYREVVRNTILSLGWFPSGMEHWPVSGESPVDLCRKKVEDASVFVGIYAHRYGWRPDGFDGKSITELEFDWAANVRRNGKPIPRLCFIMRDDFPWPDGRKEIGAEADLKRFKSRVKAFHAGFFTTPDDLNAQVSLALAKVKAENQRTSLPKLVLIAVVLLVLGLISITLIQTTSKPFEAAIPIPTRLPAGFNVVAAGFGYQQSDGQVVTDTRADDLSDVIFDSIKEIPEISTTLGWRDNGIGRILSADPEARAAQAEALAAQVGADVVIYGVVRSEGLYDILEPEFYVAAEFASVDSDLIGAAKLGVPVEVLSGADDPALSAGQDLQRRVQLLRSVLRGLSLYLVSDFEKALEAFDEALLIEADGVQSIAVFAGNAAVRAEQNDVAWAHYTSALKMSPGNARALIGRGVALMAILNDWNPSQIPAYKPELKLTPTSSCSQVEQIVPETPQEIALLALACYDEADTGAVDPDTDIAVKAGLGRGQIYIWMTRSGYGDYWQQATVELSGVVDAYQQATPQTQVRIRAFAAQSSAWLGLIILSQSPSDSDAVTEARDYYQQAVNWLEEDVNRTYNQTWVDLYKQQIDALDEWLAANG